jgi:hypothetical protein
MLLRTTDDFHGLSVVNHGYHLSGMQMLEMRSETALGRTERQGAMEFEKTDGGMYRGI